MYFIEYQPNVSEALQKLRRKEFEAGRYNPVLPFGSDPTTSPGAQHASIEDAQIAAGPDGTRSILDLERISDEPDFSAACPLSDERLIELFGTTQPTHEMVDDNDEFFEEIDRGHGIYIVVYRDGKPDEICFAGYSYD